MKKRDDHIYGWTRSGYNLLQDKKEKIMIYATYVIPYISNGICKYRSRIVSYLTRTWYYNILSKDYSNIGLCDQLLKKISQSAQIAKWQLQS